VEGFLMVRAWAFGVAGVLSVSTATVVVNPGGTVTRVIDTVQQVVTKGGGTTGNTGGAPSIGSCHAH
jgi:hypothetical protein